MIDIIKYKYMFLGIGTILVVASIVVIGVFGLKFGIDFTGGSLMELEYTGGRPTNERILHEFNEVAIDHVIIQPTGTHGVFLRFREVKEEEHQQLLARLTSLQLAATTTSTTSVAGVGQIIEKRFEAIGPTIGNELRERAFIALGAASIAIICYIAWAFRTVSRPVSSWKFGVVAVIAFLHDILIPTGLFSVLGHYLNVEIDALFISALLTIMGFSVHDTIVVFDRARENLRKFGSAQQFESIVNQSVNETMARSINTSLTVILVLMTLFFFGGATTKYLILALMVGIVVGTYSSIFIAIPLLVVWEQFSRKGRRVYTKSKRFI